MVDLNKIFTPVFHLYLLFPLVYRSKLSSLFGMDKANSQGGNESLTYTAPKQPKKKGSQQGN